MNPNIGGTAKKPEELKANIGGVLKTVVETKVNIGGILKSSYNRRYYIYELGAEPVVDIVNGYPLSSYGTVTKEAADIKLRTVDGGDDWGIALIRTDTAIDVTEYKKVCVEWDATVDLSVLNMFKSTLKVATGVTASELTNVLAQYVTTDGAYTSRINEVDISSITGNVYIGVSNEVYQQGQRNLYVYKIWLE